MSSPSRPAWRRRLARIGRTQLAFSALALLTVCSLVAAAVGTAVVDELTRDDDEPAVVTDDDPLEDEFRQAVAANPNDKAALVNLATYLANTGRIDESIDYYERAVAADPNDALLRLRFAQALADWGKPRDAELQYRRAIALKPTDPAPHYYLAELYRFGDPPRIEEAVAEYRAAIEVSGGAALVADLAAKALDELGYGTPVPAASPATPAGG